MKSLARFAYRRRWLILALWVVLFFGMNALSQSFGTAYANTFTLPGTNSTHALSLLQSGFKSKSGDVDEIVFQAKTGTIASHEKAILAMDKKVEKVPAVANVVSPFVGGSLPDQSERQDRLLRRLLQEAGLQTQERPRSNRSRTPASPRARRRSTSNSRATPSSNSPRRRAART